MHKFESVLLIIQGFLEFCFPVDFMGVSRGSVFVETPTQ